MPSIQESKASLQSARTKLAENRVKSVAQKKKLETQRSKLPDPTTQQALRGQTGPGGLAGRAQRRQVSGMSSQIETRLKDLETFNEQLDTFETEQLDTFDTQIQQAEIQQVENQQFNLAVRVFLGLASGGSQEFQNIPQPIKDQAQAQAEQIESTHGITSLRDAAEKLERENPELEFTPDFDNLKIKVTKDGKEFQSIESFNKSQVRGNDLQEKTVFQPLGSSTFDIKELQVLAEGPPPSTVEAGQRPSGLLEGLSFSVGQASERREQRGTGSFGEQIIGLGSGPAMSVLGSLIFVKQLVTDPLQTGKQTITSGGKLGGQLLTGQARFPQAGRILRQDPAFAFGFLATEIGTGFAGGKTIIKGASVLETTAVRLSPKFKPVVTGVIKDIPTTKGLKDIEIGGGVKGLSEPLSTQAKLAGQQVDAVSAQRGLFGRIQSKVDVDKPLPTPDAPPLERSFFADPRARLRPSRLGIIDDSQSTKLFDILTEDITLKKPKPQALIFPDAQIQRFPASLRDVEAKLLRGDPLNTLEKQRLLKFQLEPSGQFKPVGFLSKEPEITLAPGETIVKKAKVGVTIIEGKKVPIFEVGIGKVTKETSRLLEELKAGTLDINEAKKLIKNLKKETGIDYSDVLSSGRFVSAPAVGGGLLSAVVGSSSSQVSSPPSRPVSGSLFQSSSSPQPVSPSADSKFLNDGYSPLASSGISPPSPGVSSPFFGAPSGSSPIGGGSPIAPSPTSPSPPSPPVPTPPVTPPRKKPFGFFTQKLRELQGYDVGIIKGGKPKIIDRGLELNDARDIGAKRILEKLRATFFIRKSQLPAKDIPDTNVFAKNRNQFRPPVRGSKYNQLGEEVWIQKKHKTGGVGSRLGRKSEVQEIFSFLGAGGERTRSKNKKGKRRSRFDFF